MTSNYSIPLVSTSILNELFFIKLSLIRRFTELTFVSITWQFIIYWPTNLTIYNYPVKLVKNKEKETINIMLDTLIFRLFLSIFSVSILILILSLLTLIYYYLLYSVFNILNKFPLFSKIFFFNLSATQI